ncbi:MAG TPA: glycosyltransferase family 2 protein [Puia sp.]|jgi:glycosyltransferase involved in cell wall biosynthesis|nr:glycosyltransferase family 2 protein [Puia sp.]
MQLPKIFVVVPVFNEVTVLDQTLSDLVAHNYNIILVDDGSTDDIDIIARKYPVFFLKHLLNIGQGAALQTGMDAARFLGADIVVHFDADGQHDAMEICRITDPLLKNRCDIVFGSRFLQNNSSQSIPFSKKIVLQAARYINYLFYGILLSDAHNGFRALNRKAIQQISFTQNRMGHASEILSLVKKNKLRYLEVPVTIRYSDYSRKKGQNIFNSINIFFDLITK